MYSLHLALLCFIVLSLSPIVLSIEVPVEENSIGLHSVDTSAPDPNSEETDARLPKHLKPLHYSLTLYPHLEPPWLIEGQVLIVFEVVAPTKYITINMLDIFTHNDTVKVIKAGGAPALESKVVHQSFSQQRQMYTAELEKPLLQGSTHNLSMNFSSLLSDKLVGFYRSQYDTTEGETRWLAATQFSPTDARRAFPCFDEPGYKGTFDVTLLHNPATTARSCMPLLHSVLRDDGLFVSSFARTPVMSTYIVAFLVSDLVSLPTQHLDSTNFTVWARSEVLPQAAYANTAAPALLQYLERYFNSTFPLPKLDMVAIPDFKFNGMENWGIIKYRETAMLVEDNPSPDDLLRVAYVIAHEVSHQWFGNLVTPVWWSDLWLKEGFASFIGYLAVDAVEQDWSVMDQFVTAYQHNVMYLDSLETTHPISIHVDHPDQISEIFDAISYKKGASILRMLHQFLGPEAFRAGLTNYLAQLQYSSADRSDLWRHLTAVAGAALPPDISVATVMDSWTEQPGYPVITVTRDTARGSVTLTQDQFLLSGKTNTGLGWWVPVTYATFTPSTITPSTTASFVPTSSTSFPPPDSTTISTNTSDDTTTDFTSPNDSTSASAVSDSPSSSTVLISSSAHKSELIVSGSSSTTNISYSASSTSFVWLSDDPTQMVTLDLSMPPDAWLLVNVNASGYFRVNYDPVTWDLLSRHLRTQHGSVPPASRATLLDDAFNLARGGRLGYEEALKLTEYLQKEQHFVPWEAALNGFSYIRRMMRRQPGYGVLKKYFLSLVSPWYESVGFEERPGDGYQTKAARKNAVTWACTLGHGDCRARSRDLFTKWISDTEASNKSSEIPGFVRLEVLCRGVAEGDSNLWDTVLSRYTSTTQPTLKRHIGQALACSKEPWVLARYLQSALSAGGGVRKQDASNVFTNIANNVVGNDMAWDYLRTHWIAIRDYLGRGNTHLSSMVKAVTKSFNSQLDVKELKEFGVAHCGELASAKRAVQQSLEAARVNTAWMARHYTAVIAWLTHATTLPSSHG